ncbi:MAG: alpha/beta hydrolase [Flavobacteriales bacterium]|nr:alpha/beta hydrolase [Flavobacteriales bacterium]
MKNVTYISVELADKSRPTGRPPKTNWKIDLIKKAMKALQHASPRKVAEVVWHFFTLPGKVYFSDPQKALVSNARIGEMTYKGDRIVTYRWGVEGPRVLLCHGWRSKAADFRRMIEAFLEAGYVVEAIDCRAHGQSEGKHSAMPEFRDIIKKYLENNAPFNVVVGYSMGGAAAGVALSELPKEKHPDELFFVAAPPFVSYFFSDIIKDLGLKKSVYHKMTDMVEELYEQPVDFFDLRTKTRELRDIPKHFIYCEDDETIPFKKGMELFELHENAHFVQARGFGHYKILSHPEIINYLIEHSTVKELV